MSTRSDTEPARQPLATQLAGRFFAAQRLAERRRSARLVYVPLFLLGMALALLLLGGLLDLPLRPYLLVPAAVFTIGQGWLVFHWVRLAHAERACTRANRARAMLAEANAFAPWTSAREAYAQPLAAGRYTGALITCRGGGRYRADLVTRDPIAFVTHVLNVVRRHVSECGECSGRSREAREECEGLR